MSALSGALPRLPAMADYFGDDPRSTRERMLAGDPYIADDPQLEAEYRRALALSQEYSRAYVEDPERAKQILGELLGSVGDGTEIRPPLTVDYGSNVYIGAHTFVNFNLTALDPVEVRIGDHCQLGPNVQLLTPTHPIDPVSRRDGVEAAERITIGDNVWLGGGVIVCPGVSIGNNSVIGAGSVVTRDIPANVIAVGNPARVLRAIPGPTEA